MWTIGYIHYITNKIAYITYSHVDHDIPYQLKLKDFSLPYDTEKS